MISVKIKNVASQLITHERSDLVDISEAQAWISQMSNHPAHPWGKPEHQIEGEGHTPEAPVLVTIPSEFEVIVTDITAQIVAEKNKIDTIARGRDARLVCEKVLDLISGFNLTRELTMEQITDMQVLFADIEKALRSGRPSFAKAYITAIEVDGILVTQEMKDLCLELLAAY